jgi:hypothetical protein
MEEAASITAGERIQHHHTVAYSQCSSPALQARATVLPITVLHILQHQQPHGFGVQGFPSCEQRSSGLKQRNGQQQHMHSSGSRSQS